MSDGRMVKKVKEDWWATTVRLAGGITCVEQKVQSSLPQIVGKRETCTSQCAPQARGLPALWVSVGEQLLFEMLVLHHFLKNVGHFPGPLVQSPEARTNSAFISSWWKGQEGEGRPVENDCNTGQWDCSALVDES